jgi:hypothetical protein
MERQIVDAQGVVGGLRLFDSIIPMLWRVGSVVAGLVAIVAGFLYAKQESLLYFPGAYV